jgi:hypothetical protein
MNWPSGLQRAREQLALERRERPHDHRRAAGLARPLGALPAQDVRALAGHSVNLLEWLIITALGTPI